VDALFRLTLTAATGETARFVIHEVEHAALLRLADEYELSRAAITRLSEVGESYLEQLGTSP